VQCRPDRAEKILRGQKDVGMNNKKIGKEGGTHRGGERIVKARSVLTSSLVGQKKKIRDAKKKGSSGRENRRGATEPSRRTRQEGGWKNVQGKRAGSAGPPPKHAPMRPKEGRHSRNVNSNHCRSAEV